MTAAAVFVQVAAPHDIHFASFRETGCFIPQKKSEDLSIPKNLKPVHPPFFLGKKDIIAAIAPFFTGADLFIRRLDHDFGSLLHQGIYAYER